MTSKIVIDGVEMTAAAAECVREAGVDVAADLARVHSGTSKDELLDECLSGADDDRVQGWRDYVRAVVAQAIREDDAKFDATRIDSATRQADQHTLRGERCQYSVPVYLPRAGKSVDAVASDLGGVVPARGARVAAERDGKVIAMVFDGGLGFPVVAK